MTGAVAALLVLCSGAVQAKEEEGFVPLLNGKDFTGWKFHFNNKKHDPAKTFTVEDGVTKCTGRPNGYMYTEKKYKHFILRFDWRYERPKGLEDDWKYGGNSGYLLFVQKVDSAVYGTWPRTLELQGRWKDVAHVFPLGIKAKFDSSKEAREKARKPLGEWNTYEIVSKGGVVTATVNGVKITTVHDHDLNGLAGHICFQSEGGAIRWRNVRIRELGE